MANYNRNRNDNNNNNKDTFSWGLLIFLWLCWWPLGAAFTVAKLVAMKRKRDEDATLNARRDAWRNSMNGEQAPPQPGEYGDRPGSGAAAQQSTAREAQRPGTAKAPETPETEHAKAARRQKLLTALMLVAGVVFAIVGFDNVSEGVNSLLWSSSLYGWIFTEYLIPGVLEIIGGAGLFFTGLRSRANARHEKLLARITGLRDHVALSELSAASGLDIAKTRRIVQAAIDHGLFDDSSYVDMRSQTLVVRGAAPVSPAPAGAPKPAEPAAPPAGEDKYQKILRQLREVNDAIPGEEMSSKISRLETVSARIFELAKQDPKKLPRLQKFMDYYLPTSLKLLNTYANLDRQDVAGENITETKASIENAMDMLVSAFENQLDKLFETDALDVSSDIAALQGMLNMDGLSPTNEFDTKQS